jgi:hypothetical protein
VELGVFLPGQITDRLDDLVLSGPPGLSGRISGWDRVR